MTDTEAPANEQLARWLDHHRLTQTSFARLIAATQARVSSWLHGKSRPGPADRAAIFRATGIQFPEQQRTKPTTTAGTSSTLPAVTTPASSEAIIHLRTVSKLLPEIAAAARALQGLPGVLAAQTRTNQDIHAGLELLVARLADGDAVHLPTQTKSNGSTPRP